MGRPSHRERIIEAGVATIHARGFATTGVRAITAAAGVPQGSFTNHFASKEAFGVVVLDRYLADTEAIIGRTLHDAARRPVERLLAYFDAVAAKLEAVGWRHGCMIGNLSLEAAEHSDLIRGRLAALHDGLRQPFADVIAAAQRAGEIHDDLSAHDLAEFLLASWQGAMMRMKVDRRPDAIDRFRRVALVTLLAPSTPADRCPATRSSTRRRAVTNDRRTPPTPIKERKS